VVINDRSSNGHQHLLDWCGEEFDPRDFNLQDVEERLLGIRFRSSRRQQNSAYDSATTACSRRPTLRWARNYSLVLVSRHATFETRDAVVFLKLPALAVGVSP